ncbi:acetyltransferase [Aeromicrobium wangtongii]|uniref:Acetyltransferase n=1 Tax=Aeromicrobium wangtongii TaxID=2969247 RepID=A0ABY5MCL3_9ACTN|nr:acetyltransferase [Aeromicrobium wangtongii]MCD9196892.1 acetyltransferase [Aeromicrobium wangtongii]UUP14398.1 acetyltransferase [Aeromicrobium wangtongii]
MNDLILIGAGGLAREVAEAVAAADRYRIVGIVDDDAALHGTSVGGISVIGGLEQLYWDRSSHVVVCTGQGLTRRAIVAQLAEHDIGPSRFGTVVHPSVHVPRSCFLGVGSVLLAHVAITADARIGRHVVAMPNVTVTHDDVIGDYATLCAGVSLAGGVSVGEAAYLGTNASVRQGLRVGADSTLGMGSTLLSDLPDHQTWAGVPARLLGASPHLRAAATMEAVS